MEKSFLIVGFSDKNKMANFYKSYIKKGNAINKIKKMKNSGIYQCIVLREEIAYTGCGVETSHPILIINQ